MKTKKRRQVLVQKAEKRSRALLPHFSFFFFLFSSVLSLSFRLDENNKAHFSNRTHLQPKLFPVATRGPLQKNGNPFSAPWTRRLKTYLFTKYSAIPLFEEGRQTRVDVVYSAFTPFTTAPKSVRIELCFSLFDLSKFGEWSDCVVFHVRQKKQRTHVYEMLHKRYPFFEKAAGIWPREVEIRGKTRAK